MKRFFIAFFFFALVTGFISYVVAESACSSPCTFLAVDDTYVDQTLPTMNYGAGPELQVKWTSATQKEARALAKFVISGIPKGAKIDKATLNFEVVTADANQFDVEIGRASTNWVESTVNWSNKPAYADVVVRKASATDFSFDVKSIVDSWINGGKTNYGFVVRVKTAGVASDRSAIYKSMEGASGTPSLDIEYTPDTGAPEVTDVKVTSIKGSSATISWTTNEKATSVVDYGADETYGKSKTDAALVTAHSVTLTNLAEKTEYHFRVKSVDLAGNSTIGTDQKFKTIPSSGDITAPVIVNVAITEYTPTSFKVSWQTDELANSTVIYGESEAYGQQVQAGEFLVKEHMVEIKDLKPGTNYYLKVKSADADGNESESEGLQASTKQELPAQKKQTGINPFYLAAAGVVLIALLVGIYFWLKARKKKKDAFAIPTVHTSSLEEKETKSIDDIKRS